MRKKIVIFLLTLIIGLPLFSLTFAEKANAEELIVGAPGSYDVVVYGATSAGVTSAISAKKEGANVLLVAQTQHIGGLTSSGLGATDIANKNVVGGLSKDFYSRIYDYYKDNPSAWTSETWDDYYKYVAEADKTPIFGGKDDALHMMWVFEPKVAQKVFKDMLIEAGVPVVFGERIDLDGGVITSNGRITKIISENGNQYSAKVFIDASYEGDLMAKAGVTYRVGREANSEYNETMNGVLINESELIGTSPYIVANDPKSGLLPFIEDKAPGVNGEADGRAQAYCFRFTLTTDPSNKLPITKPENYHPEWFELRARRMMQDPNTGNEFTQNRMPNNKTDTNHADFVGMSYEYADGDYLSRVAIEQDHRDYALNLMYFYAYDERVPKKIRDNMLTYGLPKDEFLDNENFPVQIYLREGRRMVSDYVMKEGDVIQNPVMDGSTVVVPKLTAPMSIGQGFYWFDSHRVSYFTGGKYDGIVATDGNFWSSRRDYPISYKSVTPKASECENLYVPVCLSSTHAAYGSIRMETTYMIMGESCGTAAAMAAKEIASNTAFKVQDLNYAALAVKLNANGQLLGDIVLDESFTSEEKAIILLEIKGVISAEEAAILQSALVEAKFETPTRVALVKKVLFNSTKIVNKNVTDDTAIDTLVVMGVTSNPAIWAPLFGATLPASLDKVDVLFAFEKINEFFVKPAPNGYIYDWTEYFRANGIINQADTIYFNQNAIRGKNPDGKRSGDLLYALAKTVDPDCERISSIQSLANAGISINVVTWQAIVNYESSSVAGGDFNTILSRIYGYLKANADKAEQSYGFFYMNKLISNNIVLDSEYKALSSSAVVGKTVSSALAKKIIINSAKFIDVSATAENALTILNDAGIIANASTWENVMNGENAPGGDFALLMSSVVEYIINTPISPTVTQAQIDFLVEIGIIPQLESEFWLGVDRAKSIKAAYVKNIIIRVGSRMTGGSSALGNLEAAEIIVAATKKSLQPLFDESYDLESDFSGRVAGVLFNGLHDYVYANNVKFTPAQIDELVKYGILTNENKAEFLAAATTFGDLNKDIAKGVLELFGAKLDPSAINLETKLSALEKIGAIANKQSWIDSFNDPATTTIYGNNMQKSVLFAVNYLNSTYSNFMYLNEKGHITAEQTNFWILNSKSGAQVPFDKMQELILSFGKALDSTVTTGAQAVEAMKAKGIITVEASWLSYVNATEGNVSVDGMHTVVERIAGKLKADESTEPSIDEAILNYFETKYLALNKGNFFGNQALTKDKILMYSKNGVTIPVNDYTNTLNIIVRVVRCAPGKAGATQGTLIKNINSLSGFKYSEDINENAELKAYWEARYPLKSNLEIDGGKFKSWLETFYAYLVSVS